MLYFLTGQVLWIADGVVEIVSAAAWGARMSPCYPQVVRLRLPRRICAWLPGLIMLCVRVWEVLDLGPRERYRAEI